MRAYCLECGAEIIGRIGKKFCSDSCRNDYHNNLYRKEKQQISHVNKRLAANRRILKHFYAAGLRKVPRVLLEDNKFDFDYYTSSSTSPLGKTTYRCYEYSYSSHSHKIVKIEKD